MEVEQLNGELTIRNREIAVLRDSEEQLKKKVREWMNRNDGLTVTCAEKDAAINVAEGARKAAEEEATKAKEELAACKTRIPELEARLRVRGEASTTPAKGDEAELNNLREQLAALQATLDAANVRFEIRENKWKEEKNSLTAEIQHIKSERKLKEASMQEELQTLRQQVGKPLNTGRRMKLWGSKSKLGSELDLEAAAQKAAGSTDAQLRNAVEAARQETTEEIEKKMAEERSHFESRIALLETCLSKSCTNTGGDAAWGELLAEQERMWKERMARMQETHGWEIAAWVEQEKEWRAQERQVQENHERECSAWVVQEREWRRSMRRSDTDEALEASLNDVVNM